MRRREIRRRSRSCKAATLILLFMLTITLTVCGHNFLHLPPLLGMMTGLGLLKFFGYYLKTSLHFFLLAGVQALVDFMAEFERTHG